MGANWRLEEAMSKLVVCRRCGKEFVVAELGRQRVSLAEAEGLCGVCYWKSHGRGELEIQLRNIA